MPDTPDEVRAVKRPRRAPTKDTTMTESLDLAGALRRLDMTERNVSDQARTLTALTGEIGDVKSRIGQLEDAHQERRVTDATAAAREVALQTDIAQMKADITSIKATAFRALWIFISAIIVAFAAFVIKGGFA